MIELLMNGETLPIEHNIRIGRDPDWADVVIKDDQISRHHMEIRLVGDIYRVWDMGSHNGTTLNGKPVGAGGTALKVGDVVRVGDVIDLKVVSLEVSPSPAEATAAGPGAELLTIQLQGDQFTVNYVSKGRIVRDTIPYQLGLALSLLAYHQRDGFGPVSDIDLRAFVWRGDKQQMERGDINRLLLRVRSWFRDRDIEPPKLARAPRSGTTRLELKPASLTIRPDGWIDRFLKD